ncbi:hypothetical protein HY546_02410 [archaeon]|nr:hypothetical protein [archaeon]
MKTYQIQEVASEKKTIASIAESLAEEIASRMYHKLVLLKHIPEIRKIESGKAKALRGKEVLKFLERPA